MYIPVDCYKEHVTGLAGSFKSGDRFGGLLILGMVILRLFNYQAFCHSTIVDWSIEA